MKYLYAIVLYAVSLNASAQLGIDFDTKDTNYCRYFLIDTTAFKNNKWQVGTPNKTNFTAAYTAPYAIVTDTLLPCSPHDTSVFILKIDNGLGGTSDYVFWHKLDIDTGDITKIEISIDTQKHWYNVLDTMIKFTGSKPDFTPGSLLWNKVHMNINPAHVWTWPKHFFFKFTFIAGASTKPRDGWMLDSFHYLGYGDRVATITNHLYAFYPNPANATLNLSFKQPVDKVNVQLVNIVGVIDKKMEVNNVQTVSIDTRNVPEGIYYLQIGIEAGKLTEKIVIQH